MDWRRTQRGAVHALWAGESVDWQILERRNAKMIQGRDRHKELREFVLLEIA